MLFKYIWGMAILVQNVVTQCASALDAEGSDRYLFDLDYRPAIQYSMRWMVVALNNVFSQTKGPAESLRELINTRVYQANNYSRVAFNPADLSGEKLWTLLSIHPEATTIEPRTIDPTITGATSKVRLDLTFRGSEYSAERLTFEQFNQNQKNIFLPGNTIISGELKRYSYLDFSSYVSNNYNPPGTYEVEIRPTVSRSIIGIRYLKYPDMPQLITDSIQFPDSVTDMIVEKALQWISWKQGDQTTLYSVTERDIQVLIGNLI